MPPWHSKETPRGLKVKAVAYIRTSSAANVGAGKNSDKRQRQAIAAFAKRAGLELVGERLPALHVTLVGLDLLLLLHYGLAFLGCY